MATTGGKRTLLFSIVLGLIVSVAVAVALQAPVVAARSAPTSPLPACVISDTGVAGLGCVSGGDVSSITSGSFSTGGSFVVNSSPNGLGPCLTHVSTGCYYSLGAPSIQRCVYVANNDPTDVRSCGSLSTSGSISASSAQRVGSCSGALGGTFVYGGSALQPSTWWITRAASLSQCRFNINSTVPINNLRGPTFMLVRTSVAECIEPGGGFGCDEAWATLATRVEYGWLPVTGTLAPTMPIARCRVVEQSGPGGSVITFEDLSELSEPGSTSLQTTFTFPDGTSSTASVVTKTAELPGPYRTTITATSGNGNTDRNTCSAQVVDEAELSVDLTLEPRAVTLQLDESGEPIPAPVTATLTITNVSDDDVSSVAIDANLATTLERGPVKAIAQTGPPIPATTELGAIPVGGQRVVTFPFEVTGGGIFGVEALVRWADPVTLRTQAGFDEDFVKVEVDDGFEIALSGELTASPIVVRVIAEISNTGAQPISDITWPAALDVDVIDGSDPLSFVAGPLPGLPTSLAPGATETVSWNLGVVGAGTVVYTLEGWGSTASGEVSATEEITATVTDGFIESLDLQRIALAGIENVLAEVNAQVQSLYTGSAAEVLSETEQFRRAQYESWRSLGFSDTTARFLASGDVQQQAISNYFVGLFDGAVAQVDQLGGEDGEKLWRVWDTATDPVKRAALAELILTTAQNEFGYLTSGLADPNRPGVVSTTADAWRNVGTEVTSSIQFAWDGQFDLWRIESGEFLADPLKFSTKIGDRHGGQGGAAGYYFAVGVAEEALTGGLGPITRSAQAVEGGVDALRNGSRAADAGDAATSASGPVGSSTRRLAEAEQRALRFDDLPYGSTVDMDDLRRLGGISETDAARVQQIIADAKTKFGVDLQIVFRTAEPNSVGIDGVGKRAFTKEKAVSELDVMLGAPESLRGKVSIFEPQPLPQDVLRSMESASPGFTQRYVERFETQKKNWSAFQADNARTQRLAEASRRYEAEFGGITVLDAMPGRPTYGVDFVEQLNEPGFIARHVADPDVQARWPGVTADDLEGLRTHPSRIQTNIVIDEVDGAFTVSERSMVRPDPGGPWQVSGQKPIISDYDAQAVLPVGGKFPPGKRGQIETFVKTELDKIGRSGRHGWSDAANDLPSDYFDLAAEFVMSTTPPGAAREVATQLAGRFDRLSKEFAAKASRLEQDLPSMPNAAAREAAVREIARLRGLANKYDKLKSPDDVLAKFSKTGEKTVVFGQGRITVGSNAGNP